MIFTKKYVRFFYPGAFCHEETTEEVDSFSIPKVPSDALGFEFYEKEICEEGGKTFEGKSTDHGKTYFIGTVVPFDEIPDTKENSILRSNILSLSPSKEGILTHVGSWGVKDESNVVLAPENVEFLPPRIYRTTTDKSK